MDLTSIATGVGVMTAILAALFSGLTLSLTGRRETRKWLRESLIDALVQFLNGSFSRPHRRAHRLRASDGDPVNNDPALLEDYLKKAEIAHHSQNDALTKLRLLASREVVQAAEALHEADDEMSRQVLGAEKTLSQEEYDELRASQKSAREALISEARKMLRLREGAPIVSGHKSFDVRGLRKV